MKQGIGRAHGKIILVGEHAVVYNHPAISIPFFETQCEVTVEEAIEMTILSDIFTGKLQDAPSSLQPITQLVLTLRDTLHTPDLAIQITSNIPEGSGMGSSAAVASSVVEAIYDFLDLPLEDKVRYHWTQFAETLAHGNPSGIDALTTTYHNGWLFQKNKKPIPFSSQLPAYLVVGNSLEKGNTKESVMHVKEQVDKFGGKASIEAIAIETTKCFDAYLQLDAKTVGECLTAAQKELKLLGVSTNKIDNMVKDALELGALGAKLTGGGKGGCVIALAVSEENAIMIRNHWQEQFTHQVWIRKL